MRIKHLNIVRRLWNKQSGIAQRKLALRKEEIKEGTMETHRVMVTVSDPHHTMSTMRKEKIMKRVKVKANDREHAVDSAIHHYKKAGYKVHDHEYIGKVNESVELEEATMDDLRKKLSNHTAKALEANKRGDDEAVKKHQVAMNKVKDQMTKLVRNEEVELDEASGAYEKAEENKRSAEAAKKQGDHFAYHLHMADHHDNLAQWHSEKGRHGEADRHAEKSEQHHEKAMTHKESVEHLELEEVVKLGSKVKIHAPGKDYHDKVGHVGEVRHGAYKGAPKTYTVDYDNGKSVQLDKKNVKLHKESVELYEAVGKDHTMEAHGVKGVKGTPWRKSFKSHEHAHEWAEKNDAEIHGTRDLEKSKGVKEETTPYWKKPSWIKKMSKAAKKERQEREKKETTTEEVAANNVGGGAIAGTQGDAGKKAVMTKEPLKRQKLKNFKEYTDLKEAGLWDNIHAKRKRIKNGSGERMRKPGEKGAPTAADFKAASESVEVHEAAVDAKGHKSSTGGLTQKGRDYYNNKTGGNLQAPVTTPPSKLDPDSKAAKRRKSFCARMGGMPGPMKDEKGRPTRKALALRKWNC